MPELAAHLERVAQLAAKWPHDTIPIAAPDLGPSFYRHVCSETCRRCEFERGLAAALAACAREARLDEAKWWEPYVPEWFLTAAEQRMMVERLAALERAVEEKA